MATTQRLLCPLAPGTEHKNIKYAGGFCGQSIETSHSKPTFLRVRGLKFLGTPIDNYLPKRELVCRMSG